MSGIPEVSAYSLAAECGSELIATCFVIYLGEGEPGMQLGTAGACWAPALHSCCTANPPRRTTPNPPLLLSPAHMQVLSHPTQTSAAILANELLAKTKAGSGTGGGQRGGSGGRPQQQLHISSLIAEACPVAFYLTAMHPPPCRAPGWAGWLWRLASVCPLA